MKTEIATFDWKEMNSDALEALSSSLKSFNVFVKSVETGVDLFAIVMTDEEIEEEAAQKIWDKYCDMMDE